MEFEIVSNATDAVESSCTSNERSENWEITDVQIKADVCQLDNQLDNEYAQHLLSGKSVPINLNSYISQVQSVTNGSPDLNISRALTRLNSVFVTLFRTAETGNTHWRKEAITY